MDHFAGLDVSVKETSVCIVDDTGRILREVKVASEPEALLQVLRNPAYRFKRIGLEAGPLSQWLFSALAEAELPVICVETRHMQALLKAQINKTDRNDARGRFTNKMTWAEIVALYRLAMAAPPHNMPPRYNICPTDPIDVVREREGVRELVQMRWSLVPRWWSKPLKELRASTFNARAETVETKPFFRDAFRRNRCLIPMSGYYEWQNTPAGKQPWYYTARDGSALTVAGLWDSWRNPETAQPLLSCTMIVTEPNTIAAEIHDRMPVLLTRDQFEPWLGGKAGVEYLKPAPDDLLQKWPVSRRVNSSKAPADDATLIEQAAAA
jgi:putative SOS response-associated peptidase YedK